ncbi:MAG: excinuclease ABC subunit UvrC [Bacteriovoracia bacterium]
MVESILSTKIKGLLPKPGVYLMKDANGAVLYIGKAKNLKNRVSSYFHDPQSKGARIHLLVQKIADFEIVLTNNEVEALLLEFTLIKKHKPKFNIRLKDDKSYPYVRVDQEHSFPRLEYVRKVKKDKAKYFGPFVSAYQIKDFLRWAEGAFRLRDCSDAEFKNRSRPCILYQMHRCSAPCVGFVEEQDYSKRIAQVIRLLDGQTDQVVSEIKDQMLKASDAEQFEKAAELRDRIRQIQSLKDDQKIVDLESEENTDYIHFAREASDEITLHGQRAVIVVVSVRRGRVVGVFQFPFEGIPTSDAEFLLDFLVQYYIERYENAPAILPEQVILPAPRGEGEFIEQVKILASAMGKSTEFTVRRADETLDDNLQMAKQTALYHLEQLVSHASSLAEDLVDVQKKLDLKRFPNRIEGFDISHFQGEGTVASRVVFIEGKPEKKLYRHYHIKTVAGPDDFKSMREVLERRFLNDISMPDLILIDGGKGQLAQVEQVLKELGVIVGNGSVELVSIAKARTESDFQSSEIKGTQERIFKVNQKNPVLLRPATGSYRVLTQVRDESHRFAVEFHRKIRAQARK